LLVLTLRWTGLGHFQSDEYKIFYSGHETSKRNGVAIICGKQTAGTILGYNPINDRIITMRIQGKPMNMTIIQVYAPTANASEEDHENFYGKLQETIDTMPKADILILMGDLNAKVGEGGKHKAVGGQGLGCRNEAGERLIEFCESNDIRITNTWFIQPKRRLYTWTSPDNKHRNQIDYIMIKNRWATSVQATYTLPGADCGSDHELLVSKIKVKLKKSKRNEMTFRYDTQNIPVEYSVTVSNKFACLVTTEREPDELWQEVKEVVQQAAKEHVPKARRKKKSPWLSEAAIEIAGKRRLAKTQANAEEVRKLNGMFQRQARNDKEEHLKRTCTELEQENRMGRSRELFKKVREITGKFTPRIGGIKSEHGKNLAEDLEIKKRWQEYTEELYKRDTDMTEVFSEMEFDREPMVLESEVRKALNEIKNNKAAGSDGMPIELLKAAGDEGIKTLTALCQHIWRTGRWPSDWKKSVYIPIPKKGDARVCANNRTIALISHASKVMLKIIHGRMEQHMEREMPDVQAGFRKKRGTRDQIANVRWIMERAREYHQDIFLCFIDYSKAFDCVDHALMWKTLREMGFPEHLIVLMHNLYENQEATVRTEHGETDSFGIGKGVRQGCILSPTLFNLYAERVMREAGLQDAEEGIRIGGRIINNLRYADDVTLAADKEIGMKNLIEKVTIASEKAGLKLNVKKTKILSSKPIDSFSANNENIEVVKNFVMLGSVIEEDGDCREEVARRVNLGRAAMGGLSKIWKDKDISTSTKTKLVKALIFPIATYGAESWTLRQADRKKISAFEHWCWRRMLRISWTAKRTNKSITDEIDPGSSLENIIARQKLTYFGHVMRSNGLEKDIMTGMGEGKRERGRPRTRWLDEIKERTGLSLQELKEAVRDRVGWRGKVMDVTRGRHRPDGTR
jgi:exonuclease III